jgi:prophage maintenance system killer protein
MKKTIYIVFLLSIVLLLAFGTSLETTQKEVFNLSTKTKFFTAGNQVKMEFTSKSKTTNPQLYIVHSYGKTLINGTYKNGNLSFILPEGYSDKTGTVSWFLIADEEKLAQGIFEIIPNQNTKTIIENYLGPRSILAGGKEFTMMVTVPTDVFDNPVMENTAVLIKNQFLSNITIDAEKTKNFIAWKNIFSNKPSGKILVSTECKNTASKEIETEVYPNIATNFSINYIRNHEFADGNQITTLTTSIIKDYYDNVVSDGTLVSFIITTQNNTILKTFGTTIKGIATGQLLHPDHPDFYTVKGYITGIADSNSLTIAYKPILSTFNYTFSDGNRTLTVGPLKSFMNQLVPDGIKVTVNVFQGNKLVTTLQEDISNGIAKFYISSDFYKAKNYRFEITTLGITQKSETKYYDPNQQ